MEVIEYTDREGRSPFARWFAKLDPLAAAKVTRAAVRLEFGTVGDVKGLAQGYLSFVSTLGRVIESTLAKRDVNG